MPCLGPLSSRHVRPALRPVHPIASLCSSFAFWYVGNIYYNEYNKMRS